MFCLADKIFFLEKFHVKLVRNRPMTMGRLRTTLLLLKNKDIDKCKHKNYNFTGENTIGSLVYRNIWMNEYNLICYDWHLPKTIICRFYIRIHNRGFSVINLDFQFITNVSMTTRVISNIYKPDNQREIWVIKVTRASPEWSFITQISRGLSVYNWLITRMSF